MTEHRSARAPRFIADAMLGRLARWLRLLGFDTAYERDIPDERLAARSGRERRILLTRDEGFRQRAVKAMFIRSDQIWEQIRQVVREAPLRVDRSRFYRRCSLCNRPLRWLAKSQARGRVPDFVYEEQKRFACCPGCGQIYWMGSHSALFERRLAKIWPKRSRPPRGRSGA